MHLIHIFILMCGSPECEWFIQCAHSWITHTKTYSEFLNGSFSCSVTQHFTTTRRLGCCQPPPQYSFRVDCISEIRIPCSKYSWIVMIQTVVVRWATPQTLHRHSPAAPILWFLLSRHLSSIKSAVSMFNMCLVPRCFWQLSCKLIDPFLGIFVATVCHIGGQTKRPVRQLQASLTKLSALLQVVVQFRYNSYS